MQIFFHFFNSKLHGWNTIVQFLALILIFYEIISDFLKDTSNGHVKH